MARKRCVFFYCGHPILKQSHSVGAHIYVPLLILLVFLGTGVSPAWTRVPVENPFIPGLLDAPQLVQQGKELYKAGQSFEAVKVWQQAARAYQAQSDVLNQAMVLSNLSLAYQQLGQWSEATAAITNSLKLLQNFSRDVGGSKEQLKILAQALNTQGSLQLALGQSEQALTTWQRAGATYAQAGDDVGTTRSLINQAQALQGLGLYLRALATLNQVSSTLQKQPDSLIKVAGLRSLGNALRVVGDLDQSRQILQQSLTVAQQLQSPQEIGATLFSLGNTARAQQKTEAALEFYQQATDASTSPITKIQAQLNQLSLFVETKQWSDAQALSPQIQSQITTLSPSSTAVYARIDFAQSLMKLRTNRVQGDNGTTGQEESSSILPLSPHAPPSFIAQILATAVQQAKSLGDQRAEAYALGNLGGLYEQTQQWSIAQDLTQQALLLTQSINAPDISYRWQWQLGRLLKVQGDNRGAIAAYDEAVKTLQTLRYDLVAINLDVQFSFREEVEPVYRELVELLLQPPQIRGEVPSQKNLQKARETIESLQLAELNNFFRAACLDPKRQIDQVVDQEDQTAAVIYPIILADRLEVILKLPQQELRHYTIHIPQTKVESTLNKLRQQLIEPDTLEEIKSLSEQVYGWLIRPAEAALSASSVKTLVFVLDGSLRNIPMATLYDGRRQQYLIEKYSVALTPSLQLIDPKPLQRGELKAIAAGVTETRLGFYALPNVRRELEEIQAEIPSKILFNEQFTTQAFEKRLNYLPFPVVHLATHGQFSSNPDETFILAWDKRIYVKDLNNFLQSRDQSQPNAIELLVLSACQTAAGDNRAALGLAGVAVRAGARSTLASLWNVNDESTALLMSQFYRELAKNQLTKAESLRQAQLALLKNPKYQRPMVWAPYVLVGNWL